ncbi:MAG: hypothetical protein JNK61_05045 [Bacteroidia bacterium]|nr:hypothetical protein [Bacteroidia bacterium]
MSSCELINPEEPIPAYIKIDTNVFTVNTGSSSSAIFDSWVYIDNKLQGTYEMPFSIPVLYSGQHQVTISAGIKVNGLNSVRSVYPLYTVYDTTLNFEPGKTAIIKPRCTYNSNVVVNVVDDFDSGTTKFVRDADSDTMITTTNNAFEGSFSGEFYLDTIRRRISISTLNKFVIPKGRINIIELNYNCNNSFVVGLIRNYVGNSQRLEMIAVLPSGGKWRKMYISIVDAVNNLTADNYNIYIYAQIDQGNTQAKVMLDNLKLCNN